MKDIVNDLKRDTRVSSEDVERFLKQEVATKILEIDQGSFSDDLEQIRQNLQIKNLGRMRFVNDLGSTETLKSKLKEIDFLDSDLIIEILKIVKVDDQLYRYDYDHSVLLPFEKAYLKDCMPHLNKVQLDTLFREITSSKMLEFSAREIDTYLKPSRLSDRDVLIPSIQEVINDLTEDNTTQQLILQVLLEIYYDYRLENKLIVLSGADSRKSLFKSLVKSISDDRIFSSTLKSLDKKSNELDLISSRAVFITSEIIFEHQISKYLSMNQFLLMTDESNFKDGFSVIEIPLDRTEIDEIDIKTSVIETTKFRNSAISELSETKDRLRLNRVLRSSNHLNQRLNEFIVYLREISILGREEIPSSVLYALYLDFCSFRRSKSEFSSQLSFTKDLSKILAEHKYYLTDKSERAKSVLRRSEFTEDFIRDLSSSNLRFKEVIDDNKISKVYRLRLDVKELNEKLVERRLYRVSELKAYSVSQSFVEECLDDNRTLVELISRKLDKLISNKVKDSAFQTFELIRFLSRNLFLDCKNFDVDKDDLDLEELVAQISQVEKILENDMSSSLKMRLIEDQYQKIYSMTDAFERSVKTDEFDNKLLELLKDRSDFRSERMFREFRKTVDRLRKNKIRLQMIEMLCKEVKVI